MKIKRRQSIEREGKERGGIKEDKEERKREEKVGRERRWVDEI